MSVDDLADDVLATRVRDHADQEAFAALYERHAQRLHDFLLRVSRNAATAEDLTQAAFIKAWDRRADLHHPERFKSWLFTLAHRLAVDAIRQSRPVDDIADRTDLADPAPGPEGELASKEASELVWTAAASLEPRQYAVLDLVVRQGLTTPEVAAAMDVDSGHAAVLVNRSKEALGNAVRYLMAARRRDHCARLAELVPAGIRELTQEQRTSVDHHMRRCEGCQSMASQLTKPLAVLGGTAVLALPKLLAGGPPPALTAHLASAHLVAPPKTPAGDGVGPTTAVRRGARVTPKMVSTGTAVVVIVGAVATFLVVHGHTSSTLPTPSVASATRKPTLAPQSTAAARLEYSVPTSNSGPVGIVSGPDGKLWFTECSANKVGTVTTSGTFTEYPVPTANSCPDDITSGPDGNLWFTEYNGNKVAKVTTSGSFTEYTVPTASSSPYHIVSGPDGNLWFTEYDGNKVAKVTTSGTFTEYGVPTSNSGLVDIASGPDGNLWFTESNAGRVAKVTTSGSFTEYIPPTFRNPGGIAAGPDGNVWFTNSTAGGVAKVTTSGSFTEYPNGNVNTLSGYLTVGPDHNLWFGDGISGGHGFGGPGNCGDVVRKLFAVTTSGTYTEYTLPECDANPLGVSSGPDGRVWFAEGDAGKVGTLTPGVGGVRV